MANKETFFASLMESQFNGAALRSARYQVNGVDADIHDGALVTLGDLAVSKLYGNVYGAEIKDYNVYLATAPAKDTDKIVLVDLDEISQGVIAGNVYKEGIKLDGLRCLAGYPARVRVPHSGDTYFVSGDCFVSEPTVGQYATATVGDTHYTPAAEAAEGKFCVKIQAVKDFVVGASMAGAGKTGKLYFVEVM